MLGVFRASSSSSSWASASVSMVTCSPTTASTSFSIAKPSSSSSSSTTKHLTHLQHNQHHHQQQQQRRGKFYVMNGHIFSIDPFVSEDEISATRNVRKIKHINGSVVRMLEMLARRQATVSKLRVAAELFKNFQSSSLLKPSNQAMFPPHLKEQFHQAQKMIQHHLEQQQQQQKQQKQQKQHKPSPSQSPKQKDIATAAGQRSAKKTKQLEQHLIVPLSTFSHQNPRFGVFNSLYAIPRVIPSELHQQPSSKPLKRSSSNGSGNSSSGTGKKKPKKSASSTSNATTTTSTTATASKSPAPAPAPAPASSSTTQDESGSKTESAPQGSVVVSVTTQQESATVPAVAHVQRIALEASLPLMSRRKKSAKSHSSNSNKSNAHSTNNAVPDVHFDETSPPTHRGKK